MYVIKSINHPLLDQWLRLVPGSEPVTLIDVTLADRGALAVILRSCGAWMRIVTTFMLRRSRMPVWVHFASKQAIYLVALLRLVRVPVILSFWGSDLLARRSYTSLRILRRVGRFMVTVATPEMAERARELLPNCTVTQVRFGLDLLDTIARLRPFATQTIADFKCGLGLPATARLVAVGTNSSPRQQLIEVIEALDAYAPPSPATYRDPNVVFLFHMAYGDANYKRQVVQRLESATFRYVVLERFLHGDELASLRMACELCVQVQKSDALSGAMQEAIYAGSKVITGSWLPYRLFDNANIFYRKVASLEEVPPTIEAGLKDAFQPETETIKSMSSWEDQVPRWREPLRLMET